MSRYLVESQHTKEECLKALDDILAKGPEILQKFDWACAAGTHTGYAFIEAESEANVRSMLPLSMKGKTRVIEVGKFTPEQIKSLHKAA